MRRALQEVVCTIALHLSLWERSAAQPPGEHLALAKHLTAETKTEEFVAGRGVVVKWERLRKQNHWFDALYNACAAGHLVGARLVEEPPRPRRPRQTLQQMADEAPYAERWRETMERLGWNQRAERW